MGAASGECGASIAAVAARGDDAVAFAAHGIERAYGGYEQLLAAPDIDAVYIGTIDRLHKGIPSWRLQPVSMCSVKSARKIGKEAREMYVAANARRVMLQDGMRTRFMPAVEHARALIDTGEIGDALCYKLILTLTTPPKPLHSRSVRRSQYACRWLASITGRRRYSRILRQSLCQPRFHPVSQ